MTHLAALLCGALLPLSLAPFGYWPLGYVALAGWFTVLRRPQSGGVLDGWLFGVGKYGVGASWVYVSVHVYGPATPPLALFLVALFVAGLALFPLAGGWLFARLRSGRRWLDALLFAALFSGFEWLLTWVLTGFPWLFAGYAHLDTELAGLAPLGGVLLVGFAVALGAAALVLAVEAAVDLRGRAVTLAAAVALLPWLAGWLAGRVAWVEDGPMHRVALVQGNVEQSVKWQPENRRPILERYVALSRPHWDADLIIWPEAAITYLSHEATGILEALNRQAETTGTALVVGIPAVVREPDGAVVFHNTARVLGIGHGQYVKRRLVPFGEYVPLESLLRGTIEFFDLPMSHAAAGEWRQPLLDLGGYRAVMAICYEVVYPDLVRAGAAQAGVLLSISNDTWFGASIGPLQHAQMARMRALENGRWMLRATNSGVTAVIDAHGAVRARLPQFEAGTLRADFRVMRGTTPFTRVGDAPLLALLLLIAATRAVAGMVSVGGVSDRDSDRG